jgi:hypothetical protein
MMRKKDITLEVIRSLSRRVPGLRVCPYDFSFFYFFFYSFVGIECCGLVFQGVKSLCGH